MELLIRADLIEIRLLDDLMQEANAVLSMVVASRKTARGRSS